MASASPGLTSTTVTFSVVVMVMVVRTKCRRQGHEERKEWNGWWERLFSSTATFSVREYCWSCDLGTKPIGKVTGKDADVVNKWRQKVLLTAYSVCILLSYDWKAALYLQLYVHILLHDEFKVQNQVKLLKVYQMATTKTLEEFCLQWLDQCREVGQNAERQGSGQV